MDDSIISLTRIKQHYHLLSISEKRIADFILENYRSFGNITAQGIADSTQTSPATIIRFCRSIGFKGFVDFKIFLKNEVISPSANWLNVSSEESMAMIKQKSFAFNRRSMDETLSIIDDEALEKTVELIDKAPQILIIGEGGSGSSSRAAYDAFLQIGIRCDYIEDPFFQILAISNMEKKGIVLGFSHSGMSRNVFESIKLAHERGITTIGFVGITGSPLTKHLDIVLFTGVSNHTFFSDTLSARICELNVVSTIHAALSIKRKDELGDYHEKVSKLLSIKRVKR
ncbi:MAG: MurR/RpiR family transcriptional regulator [Spirochaetia bacterium]|nr:MurR/RpiR family transcriptional regulator [Spirochaetia bacterium]